MVRLNGHPHPMGVILTVYEIVKLKPPTSGTDIGIKLIFIDVKYVRAWKLFTQSIIRFIK